MERWGVVSYMNQTLMHSSDLSALVTSGDLHTDTDSSLWANSRGRKERGNITFFLVLISTVCCTSKKCISFYMGYTVCGKTAS